MATMVDVGMGDHINMERLHAVVHGDVQGVGFRYFVQRKAQQLGLQGWVRNNDDGSVELVAEGGREALEQLKRALQEGPRMARVDRVETQWSTGTGTLRAFELAW
jgi:acylphosphatase